MKVITPENDTRTVPTATLIQQWGVRLYEASSKRDWLRYHELKRQLPQGLLSAILVREAEFAAAAVSEPYTGPLYRFTNALSGGAWLVENGHVTRWTTWSELRRVGARPDHHFHGSNFITAPDITKPEFNYLQ